MHVWPIWFSNFSINVVSAFQNDKISQLSKWHFRYSPGRWQCGVLIKLIVHDNFMCRTHLTVVLLVCVLKCSPKLKYIRFRVQILLLVWLVFVTKWL